ncbi:MAG: hypothetical protein ACRD8Z_02690, partial [Nitrososphaeraceae archaeon]
MEKILEFLICYKAFVRAKVSSFQARSESAKRKKFKLLKEADAHILLAEQYPNLTNSLRKICMS